MDTIMEVKDLNLWYGDHHALHDISVDIPKNQITALIGPSGCGKSTFLKTLNRMNDLVEGIKITGNVIYNGENIYAPKVDVTWLRKRVGMVFQKPGADFQDVVHGFAKFIGFQRKSSAEIFRERSRYCGSEVFSVFVRYYIDCRIFPEVFCDALSFTS